MNFKNKLLKLLMQIVFRFNLDIVSPKLRAAGIREVIEVKSVKRNDRQSLSRFLDKSIVLKNLVKEQGYSALKETLQITTNTDHNSKSVRSKHRITVQLDDTHDGKKHGKSYKKAKRLFDRSTGGYFKTHKIVFLTATLGWKRFKKRIILGFRVWNKKSGKTHLSLGLEMVSELKAFLEKEGFKPLDVVITFDSGYTSTKFLDKLDEWGFYFVGKFHRRHKVDIQGYGFIEARKFANSRLNQNMFLPVGKQYRGTTGYDRYCELGVNNFAYRLFLCVYPTTGHRKIGRVLLVSNMPGQYFTIVTRYPLRWSIETIFSDLKEFFDFYGYHMEGDGNKYENYLRLCIVRFNLWETVPKYLRTHYRKRAFYLVSTLVELRNEFGKFIELDL